MGSWFSTARVFSLIAAAIWTAGCKSTPPLPSYGAVPDFQLTAQTGQPFHRTQLDGSVWVVDFIFTNCTGPCPRMTSQLKQVQRETSPDVRLVSISIDPKRDTPEVLAEYARKFRVDTGRWTFLTGPREVIHNLSRNVFKLGDVDDSLTHSTRFVLVDRQARIRGFYGSFDTEGMAKLIEDIKSVSKEKT